MSLPTTQRASLDIAPEDVHGSIFKQTVNLDSVWVWRTNCRQTHVAVGKHERDSLSLHFIAKFYSVGRGDKRHHLPFPCL